MQRQYFRAGVTRHFVKVPFCCFRAVGLGMKRYSVFGSISVIGLSIFSAYLSAQSGPRHLPMPTVKPCGSPSGVTLRDDKSEALAALHKAVSAMDPNGVYSSAKMFTISGQFSDARTKTNAGEAKGTFAYKEDHSSAHGLRSRTTEINGESHSSQVADGQVSPAPAVLGSSTPAKLAFVPKSVYFPLALLLEELSNSKVTAALIRERANSPTSGEFPGLTHIRTVNETSSQSMLYETEDWYLDPATSLPIFVGYELPVIGKPTSCVETYAKYEGFATMSQAYIPTSVLLRRGGDTIRIATIQTLGYSVQ